MPNAFEVSCAAPPSMFAYPKIEEKKEGKHTLVEVHLTALSRACACVSSFV